MNKVNMNNSRMQQTILATLLTTTIISGLVLSSSIVSADDVVDNVSITISQSCTMSGTGNNTHTATIDNGTYQANIGTTTMKVLCNDNAGFSIYAIGFTDNKYDGANHTKLVGTSASNNATIATGTNTSAGNDDISNWAMKLSTDTTATYPITIQSNYDSYSLVPDTYTKVATRLSGTDVGTNATGSTLTTTYAAYISKTQPADTYTGQVKYTLVHPNTEPAPFIPSAVACQAGKICYNTNAGPTETEGTMGVQNTGKAKDWSSCASTDNATYCRDSSYNSIDIDTLPELDDYADPVLLASNFSRTGYGFAGWSDAYDYATNPNAHFYGPNETINYTEDITTNGLSLYAVWIKSEGSLQDSLKVSTLCGTGTGSLTQAPAPGNGTATLSSVSALTDQRDSQTYAIAKLADGNCWMIENLRLESEDSVGEANIALAQGYGSGYTGLPSTPAPYGTHSYDNSSTQNRAISPTSNSYRMYSYGNQYGFEAAVARDGFTPHTDYIDTSICPNGWRLPYGGNTGYGAMSGSFSQLDISLGGTGNEIQGSSLDIAIASSRWRSYPNNYLLYPGLSATYWTSAAYSSYGTEFSYSFSVFASSNYNYFHPGTSTSDAHTLYPIRCVSAIQP